MPAMQQVFIAAKEAWLPHCNDSCVIPLPSSCCGFSPESWSQLKCGMQFHMLQNLPMHC
jgi:hypothetical protein